MPSDEKPLTTGGTFVRRADLYRLVCAMRADSTPWGVVKSILGVFASIFRAALDESDGDAQRSDAKLALSLLGIPFNLALLLFALVAFGPFMLPGIRFLIYKRDLERLRDVLPLTGGSDGPQVFFLDDLVRKLRDPDRRTRRSARKVLRSLLHRLGSESGSPDPVLNALLEALLAFEALSARDGRFILGDIEPSPESNESLSEQTWTILRGGLRHPDPRTRRRLAKIVHCRATENLYNSAIGRWEQVKALDAETVAAHLRELVNLSRALEAQARQPRPPALPRRERAALHDGVLQWLRTSPPDPRRNGHLILAQALVPPTLDGPRGPTANPIHEELARLTESWSECVRDEALCAAIALCGQELRALSSLLELAGRDGESALRRLLPIAARRTDELQSALSHLSPGRLDASLLNLSSNVPTSIAVSGGSPIPNPVWSAAETIVQRAKRLISSGRP